MGDGGTLWSAVVVLLLLFGLGDKKFVRVNVEGAMGVCLLELSDLAVLL
jgi:hypothetical protein